MSIKSFLKKLIHPLALPTALISCYLNYKYLLPLLWSHNSSAAFEAIIISWIICVALLVVGFCVTFGK